MTEIDPPTKKDFFISYNKADREWAEWIAWQLDQWSHSVVLHEWDFRPGSNFVREMDRAIQECERVITVLSPDYLTSLFKEPEWTGYFGKGSIGQSRRLVPVCVRESEPKGLIATMDCADLIGKPENEARAALLYAVNFEWHKPKRAPDVPGQGLLSKPRFPGPRPDIWNVARLRNPNFIEPGQQLNEMRDALRSGRPTAFTQALTGLGGVGKTQLAIEYAYRYAADYALIWWVRAEQPATLMADYAALGTALDLPERHAGIPAILAAVRDALQHRRDWLLVFDNANAPEEIRDYLPATGGHVLITSRHAAWGGVAQAAPVKKWSPEVGAEFLLKRTGLTDVNSAKELANELDYLPLALEQAAAYIRFARKTLPGYLTMFRQHKLFLLEVGRPTTDYPSTAATTLELSLQRLERESPGVALLLQLCAFFASNEMPREMIAAGAEHLPKPLRALVNDPLAFDDAVRTIRGYSLIEVGEASAVSVHRLVRTVIRERVGEAGRQRWTEISEQLVTAADRLKEHAAALPVYFDANFYNAAEIAEVLGYFSDYYEALAGDRLVIDGRGTLEPTAALVP